MPDYRHTAETTRSPVKLSPTATTRAVRSMSPSKAQASAVATSDTAHLRESMDEFKLHPDEVLVIKDGTIKLANPRKEPEPQYDVNGELIKASGTWTQEEHDRFLKAIANYPKGPWKAIAQMVGTRTVRQTQTHAQKYREKIARRLRGLRNRNGTLQTPPMRMQQLVPAPVYSQVLVPSSEYDYQCQHITIPQEYLPMQPLTSVLTDEQGVPISWENCVTTAPPMYATAASPHGAMTLQQQPDGTYTAVSPAMHTLPQYAYPPPESMLSLHPSYFTAPAVIDAAAAATATPIEPTAIASLM